MLYKYIVNGNVCWLSKRTINKLEAERKAIEDEQNAYRAMWSVLEHALATDDPTSWSIYSDLHKDIYGVRPHW